MEVSGQLHAPAVLPPVPTEQEPGWAPEPVWMRWWGKNKSQPCWSSSP